MTDFSTYAQRLAAVLASADWSGVEQLADAVERCWREGRTVFLCGNGGSAANAAHLANDFLYGVAKRVGAGIKTHALSANAAVLTCLGNDIGYDKIFSHQVGVLAEQGDILIVLSGSGNSANIVEALQVAKTKGVATYAILGYGGGRAKALADVAIHFAIDDMQISEDLQLTVGHMVMQRLYADNSKAAD